MFSYNGIMKFNAESTVFEALYISNILFASDIGANKFCMYWFVYKLWSEFTISNFWRYNVFCPLFIYPSFTNSTPPISAFSNVFHPCSYAYFAAFSKISSDEFPVAFMLNGLYIVIPLYSYPRDNTVPFLPCS